MKEPLLLADDVRGRIAARAFRALKADVAALPASALAAAWPGFAPFDKIVVFKLLDASRADALLDALSPAERGFLLGAREPGVLGPILEDMPPAEAAGLFRHLSDEEFERLAARVRSCT
jgi:Mg/Co/Ni transporter MgtE